MMDFPLTIDVIDLTANTVYLGAENGYKTYEIAKGPGAFVADVRVNEEWFSGRGANGHEAIGAAVRAAYADV